MVRVLTLGGRDQRKDVERDVAKEVRAHVHHAAFGPGSLPYDSMHRPDAYPFILIDRCRYNKCVVCTVYTLYEYGYILPESVAPYKYIGTWLTNKAATIK